MKKIFDFIFGFSLPLPLNLFFSIDLWQIFLITKTFTKFPIKLFNLLFIITLYLIFIFFYFNISIKTLLIIFIYFFLLSYFSLQVNKDDLIRILKGIILSSIFIIIYSYYEFFFKLNATFYISDKSYYRISSFFVEPNELSIYLLFFSLIIYYLFLNKKVSKNFYYIYSFLIITSQLITYSRLAILLTLYVLIKPILSKRNVIIIILFLISLFFIIEIPAIKRISQSIGNIYDDPTLLFRLNIYSKSINFYFDNFLLGIGPKNFEQYLGVGQNTTSNTLLDIIIEYGIFGIMFILIIVSRFCSIIFNKKLNSDISTMYFVITLAGLTYSILYLPIFWVMTGILFSKQINEK